MRCILLLIEGDAARHVSTSNYPELDESQLPQAPHLFEAIHMRLSVSTPSSRFFPSIHCLVFDDVHTPQEMVHRKT